MGSPDMTSVSVSFDVRRQLNSLRAMGNHRSVDDLLKAILKEYRLSQLKGESDKLRDRVAAAGEADVDALVARLNG